MKRKYGLVVVLLLLSYSLVTLFVSAMDDEANIPIPPRPTEEEYAEAEANALMAASQLQSDEDEPLECTGATENLLANPGFEGSYSDYVPNPAIPDCPWGVCFSAQMADNWTPYWQSHNSAVDEGWEMLMPEYKPATTDFTDPPRVRSGARAQQWFTFYATHRAGIYQQVYNVEPGKSYCLSVWGHAWSAYNDSAYTDLSNHNFLNQKIGVDPYGGKDFNSSNIVWTPPRTQYDEYGLFKIEVEAQSDTMTVFFNSQPQWAAKHNDVYWDDAILVQAGEPEPPRMTVSPTWMAFSAETDNPIQTSEVVEVIIENNRDNLYYDAQLVGNYSFTPTISIIGENMTVSLDSEGLPAGSHRATIEIYASDDSIDGGRQYVTIQLDVEQSDPLVEVMSSGFGFIMDDDQLSVEGGSVVVNLINTQQIVDPAWSATLDITRSEFAPTLLTTWGRSGDLLEFEVDATGYAPGTYRAYVDVRGNDAMFANVETLPIVLIVAEEVSNVYVPVVNR